MLSQRMQVQEIANVLGGLEPVLSPRDFEPPWREAFRAVLAAQENGRQQQALFESLAGRKDRDALVGMILDTLPGARLGTFPSLEAIADDLRPIEWLWPQWIPRGMLSMLAAAPGAGKSLVALDLAKRVIEATVWPNGVPIGRAGCVVYVDAEAVPQLTNERADAWEMDKSRLYLMLPESNELIIDLGSMLHQDRLVEMVHQVRPELVIIDSLGSITTSGENSVEDVRSILAFLNRLAGYFCSGMLLIHHIRKRSPLAMLDMVGLDDLRGSSHIVAVARSVLALSIIKTGPELDRNGPRRMDLIKTNLAAYPDPIGMELVPLFPEGVMVQYGEVPEPYKEPTKAEQCQEWLLEVLRENGEPMKPKEVVELAEGEFSRAMVYRTRAALEGQVVNTSGRKSPDNTWALPEMLEEQNE